MLTPRLISPRRTQRTASSLQHSSSTMRTLLTYWLGSTNLFTSENEILATAGSTSSTCTGPGPSSNATWSLCSMSFTATGATTAISLAGTGLSNFQYLGLDDVNVDQVGGNVPEPNSQALLILALAGAGVVTARKLRKH